MSINQLVLQTMAALPNSIQQDYFLAAMTAEWPSISNNRGSRRVTNLRSVAHNYNAIVKRTKKKVIAIAKARAYGGGLIPVSLALYRSGCRAFAVATPGAAVALRQALVKEGYNDAVVLILGYLAPSDINVAKQHMLSVTITDKDIWPMYKSELAKLYRHGGPKVSFQINVDTGMTRVGAISWSGSKSSMRNVVNLAKDIDQTATSQFEGIYTHFPLAGSFDNPGTKKYRYTLNQINTLEEIVKRVKKQGIQCDMVHVANSPGIQSYPDSFNQSWITHVRPGQMLYGIAPRIPKQFKPVTRWETTLTRVEKMPRRTGVGYASGGKRDIAKKGDYIGTLAVGYADGYRNPIDSKKKNRHKVRLDGVLLPIIGYVAMDMCMVNLNKYVKKFGRVPDPVTANPVELVSDGPDKDALSAHSVAQRMGTRRARLLATISTRNELYIVK